MRLVEAAVVFLLLILGIPQCPHCRVEIATVIGIAAKARER